MALVYALFLFVDYMPYNIEKKDELPDNVKALSEDKIRQWIEVWNSVYEKCQTAGGKDCETVAFRNANGVVNVKEANKVSVTKGMANAFSKGNVKFKCSECGQVIPKYAGRYPKYCPNCGEELPTLNQATQETESDEDHTKEIDSIIVEMGRRDIADAQETQINTLIQEAGTGEDITEKITDVVGMLQEADVVKTEDGVKYPAAAFAYVPDPDTPSTWKLRLWDDKKEMTRQQVGAAAAAMSPGGFRGQRVQIPREDLSKVKAKIRAAYRKLGVKDEDMSKWVKEADMQRKVLSGYISLEESGYDEERGISTITILKPGMTKDGARFYPAEMLKRDFKVFEGAQMYADHQTKRESKDQPERSIRDLVGGIPKVWVNSDGAVMGEAHYYENWLKEKLSNMKAHGDLDKIGISHASIGQATKDKAKGCDVVESIIRNRSVDIVTRGNAGGEIQMYESIDAETDVDLIDAAAFREKRPDIIEIVESEIRKGVKKRMDEQEDKVKELKESVSKLETEKNELSETVTKLEDETKTLKEAKAKDEAQAEIKKLVADSKLPEATQEKLVEDLREATSVDGVAEMIEKERVYLSKLTEAGKIKNLGESKEISDTESTQKLLDMKKQKYMMEEGLTEEKAMEKATIFVNG